MSAGGGGLPVAFVVQRYGPDVTGGSETLARALAERLAHDYAISVFTSCARDYVTWRNELAPGREVSGGVEIVRFAVEQERDLAAFNRFAEPLYRRQTTPDEEREFLRRQGPYLPALVEELRRRRDEFAAFVFFTYLYYPTVLGVAAVGRRSLLVPTTHDEPPLRFGIYRELFRQAGAFAFLTPAEEKLVRSRFDLGARPTLVGGMGVEVPPPPDVDAFRRRHAVARDYVIYAGRIDAGKGCGELLDFYARYRGSVADPVDLLLMGRLAMPEPDRPGVRYLGYLSEAEKAAALAGARAVVCPSPFESLSIVLLEAFALGVPALANARSDVLREHCLRSNAGLFYQDAAEFAEALDLIVADPRLRAALAAGGRRYVEAHHRWDAVLDAYRRLIARVAGVPAAPG